MRAASHKSGRVRRATAVGWLLVGASLIWAQPAFAAQEINVIPTSLNFGNQQINTTSPTQQVTVQNTGDQNLQIGATSITGTNGNQFTKPTDNCSNQTVPGPGSCTIDIAFAPTSVGAKTAQLNIPSDDADEPNVAVSLGGTGVDANLTVTPQEHNFGTLTPGAQSSPQTFTATSDGTANIILQQVALGGTDPTQFQITLNTCTPPAPRTLMPTQSCTVDAAFAPTSPGPKSATLVFTSNDPDSPDVAVLTGTGAPLQSSTTGGATPEPQPEPLAAADGPPDTTITQGPEGRTKKKSATIGFSGSDARAVVRFECKLDDGAFETCTSPKTYSGLKKGEHTVQVRAIDDAGNVDPTPATRSWTVKKKKRRR